MDDLLDWYADDTYDPYPPWDEIDREPMPVEQPAEPTGTQEPAEPEPKPQPRARDWTAEAIAIVPPCPICGESGPWPGMTETDAQETVQAFERLEPESRRLISELVVSCEACIMRETVRSDDNKWRDRIIALRLDTYSRGLLPKSAQNAVFHYSDRSRDVAAIDEAKAATGNLWIAGPVGVGKTHLAHCIANEHINRCKSVAQITPVQVRGFGQMFERDKENAMEPYIHAHLLIVDDIDKLNWSESAATVLFHIVDERRQHNRRVIVTSNLSINDGASFLMRKVGNGTGTESSLAAAALDRMKPLKQIALTGQSRR
jgi:DNA replication protein DnaC